VLARLAQEISVAKTEQPDLRLLLGHGSGSFGHVVAARHSTRQGVASAAAWMGFTEVSRTAAKLNKLVVDALHTVNLPAITLQPSASVVCTNGRITHISTTPIQSALEAGLLPVVYGDVAFDEVWGGTIISTEEVMMAIAEVIQPSWLLLAGETPGVLAEGGTVIPTITNETLPDYAAALGGSHGTDVTGGMASKVESMLDLTAVYPGLRIRIFSGLEKNTLRDTLLSPDHAPGTLIL
jgi:isopentenyl phosphate kinase